MTNFSSDSNSQSGPKTPLDATERRVLGVLIEKAKTTPDAYPLSLNALRTGSNQKSNRFPQMSLDEDQVDRAADSLRQKKVVSLVQGDSRVERYRHLGYDLFGVDKTELAVLAELLLRGAQTVGELRGRAARMEPIKGIAELTPILASLVEKGHITYLSPPGRGAIVAHTFYSTKEMERVCRDLGITAYAGTSASPAPTPNSTTNAATTEQEPPLPRSVTGNAVQDEQATNTTSTAPPTTSSDWQAELTALRAELKQEINDLRQEFEEFKQRVEG